MTPVRPPGGPAAVGPDVHRISPSLGNLFAQLRALMATLFAQLCGRLGGMFCASP